MFLAYSRMRPRALVIGSMVFHGLAFAFFFDAAYIYIDEYLKRVGSLDIRGSAQGLYTTVTQGLGCSSEPSLRSGDGRFREDGKFRWRPIFLIPCVLLTLCTIAFAMFFKG